jgi:hypothetical protein
MLAEQESYTVQRVEILVHLCDSLRLWYIELCSDRRLGAENAKQVEYHSNWRARQVAIENAVR